MSQQAVIRQGTENDLQSVGVLWGKLNEFHHQVGYHFQSDETTIDAWITSFSRTLGRFSFLWVAEQENIISAFLLGRLKKTPAHIGGVMVGEISDLYVGENLRGQGIGRQLVGNAMQHFSQLKVHSVEVQVMAQNSGGLEFWHSLGFQNDVILVRRMMEPGSEDA